MKKQAIFLDKLYVFKLNHEKTELIIFNPKYKSRRMTEDIQLQVGEKTMCSGIGNELVSIP